LLSPIYDFFAVSERQILSIEWHSRGYHIYVSYADGPPTGLANKKESDAATMAALHGLTLVARGDGTVRWSRRPASDEPA
jgi:hypothetical protein